MMRPRSPHRDPGYSLVELVAALTIFSLGVVGVLTLFSTCLQSTSASRGYTHAVFLAQRALEEKIAEEELYEGSESGDFGDTYPGYSWELTVEDTDQEGLMLAQLSVVWDDRGRKKEYALTTLVAERTESYGEWTTE